MYKFDKKIKKCDECRRIRPVEDFSPDKRTSDLRSNTCDKCKEIVVLYDTPKKKVEYETDSSYNRIEMSEKAIDFYPSGVMSELLANDICILKNQEEIKSMLRSKMDEHKKTNNPRRKK